MGGKLNASLVNELCEQIDAQDVALDWDQTAFCPQTAADLLTALREVKGAAVLYFCSEGANWGQFEELEAWLQENQLPFTRRTGSSTCYDGELVEFRPGRQPAIMPTNVNGRPVAAIEPVQKAWYLLKEAQQALTAGANALKPIREAVELLADVLPPELPPLEPFEVAG